MAKRRLLLLADGASIHTEKWLEGLSLTGNWEFSLISMNPGSLRPGISQIPGLVEASQYAPAEIKETGNNFGYALQIPRIFKHAKKFSPHVVNSIYLSSYGTVGALIKGRAALAHYVIGHDILLTPQRSPIHKKISAFALKRADFVVSTSQTVTDRLTSLFHYPSSCLITQNYGVSDWVISNYNESKSVDLISNRAWIVNSNIEYIVASLPQSGAARFHLVGDEIRGSEPLAQNIRKMAALNSSIKQLGSLPYEANIKAVAQAKFLISLTTSDGSPLSVIEAMAVGTIPILSDTSPNRELVIPGKNGFLVPLNQPEKCASEIRRILATPEAELQKMRIFNKEWVANKGTLRVNMGRVSERLWNLSHN